MAGGRAGARGMGRSLDEHAALEWRQSLRQRCGSCFARAGAGEYPTHPVRLIAPSGPGGNPDVLARLLAEKFTASFGKPFIVENMPGAGGIVAASMVARRRQTGMC